MIPEARAFPFIPPTISGFGASGGFSALLQDRSGTLSVDELNEYKETFMKAAAARPEISEARTSPSTARPAADGVAPS